MTNKKAFYAGVSVGIMLALVIALGIVVVSPAFR